MYHSNVIQNNENVDIKYGSHDTFQESPVSKVIIVMFKYCNAVLVKLSYEYLNIAMLCLLKEEFGDTKGAIRIRRYQIWFARHVSGIIC